jgi:hypothetical protein
MRTGRAVRYIAIAASAAALISPGIAGAKAGPHIAAKPAVLEVGEATTLTGVGFAADARITLRECAKTGWLAPQYPCDAGAMTVKTDAAGGFTATFEVRSCSGVKDPKHLHKCYVGEYEMGEDGGQLVAAAKLTVTP